METNLSFDKVASAVAHAEERVAYIRTSDMASFLSCRRKWNWSSHLKEGLGTKQFGNPLWLGSGIHYVLEDYHGERKYATPRLAFHAFCRAHITKHKEKLPEDLRMLIELGTEMMEYYPIWLDGRDELETYVFGGVKQVEPAIQIEIPMEQLPAYERIRQHYDRVVYALQLDRVAIIDGILYVVEYKTAQRMETGHYPNDPQIGNYLWAAENVYDKPVGGVIYQQHRKDLPKGARELKNGALSCAQNQRTSHRLYKKSMVDKYGTVAEAPLENIQYLNGLAAVETEHADDFIRRDFVYRNAASTSAVAQRLLQVTNDMLDPDLALYSNPSRMCNTYCSFMSPCVSKDDGSDYLHELEEGFEVRDLDYESWRPYLPDPTTFKGLKLD